MSDADLDGHDLLHFGYPPGMRRIYRDDGAELRLLLQRARARGIATALDSSNVDAAGRRELDWNRLFGRVAAAGGPVPAQSRRPGRGAGAHHRGCRADP